MTQPRFTWRGFLALAFAGFFVGRAIGHPDEANWGIAGAFLLIAATNFELSQKKEGD